MRFATFILAASLLGNASEARAQTCQVTPPQHIEISWISPWSDLLGAIGEARVALCNGPNGNPPGCNTSGGCGPIQTDKIAAGIVGLCNSSNRTPTTSTLNDWTPFVNSKQYRGYLTATVSAQCNKDGTASRASMSVGSSKGYTPLPWSPITNWFGYSLGTGPIVAPFCWTIGSKATCTVQNQFMLGTIGQVINTVLTNTSAPYAWEQMTVDVTCPTWPGGVPGNASYTVTYGGSYFPTERFLYVDRSGNLVKACGDATQSGLGSFLCAGGNANAPGNANRCQHVSQAPCVES